MMKLQCKTANTAIFILSILRVAWRQRHFYMDVSPSYKTYIINHQLYRQAHIILSMNGNWIVLEIRVIFWMGASAIVEKALPNIVEYTWKFYSDNCTIDRFFQHYSDCIEIFHMIISIIKKNIFGVEKQD